MAREVLPLEETARAGWWSMAVYKPGPGGLRFVGYTEPAWQTFSEHVGARQNHSPFEHLISWRWFNGKWWPL